MNTMEMRRPGPLGAPDGFRVSPTPPIHAEPARPASRGLANYLSVLRRRKWIILAAIVAALLAGLAVTLLMTPKFTAEATLEIQRESRNFTQVQGASDSEQQQSSADMEFYETQYGLLEANSTAERVATALRLFDSPQFFEMFGDTEAAGWFESGRPAATAPPREIRVVRAGEVLLDNVDVRPVRLSRLVEIHFTSPDAAFSQRVAGAWADHFIQATLERRFEATSYARRFLEDRLGQLRSRIDESERALVDYATRNGIVNLPAASPGETTGAATGERSLIAEQLAAINRELSRATAERVEAESRARGQGNAVTEALGNDAISGLRQRRGELGAEYAALRERFAPGYPMVQAMQAQLAQLDRAIAREEQRIDQTLRQTFDASRQREAALQQRVTELTSGVQDLRRRSIQYNIFQRDADTNRQLYDALLQRYKEIGIAGGVGVNNISIVDRPQLPERPSSPRMLLNLLLALIAGLVAGVGIAFALEQLDEGVSDPGEVASLLGVPLLGTTPKVLNKAPADELADQKSALSEAYVSLQTTLSFATDHGIPRTLAVTSSRPSEGKTTTSFALARSLARGGRRTLLLDADMRSPSIHKLFNLPNKEGLSNYLAGNDDLPALIKTTAHDGLFVMPAGPQPPSTPPLLGSDRFEQLALELMTRFDHVVFDAPPVMGLADAPLICSRVEGTLFVIESHATKKSMARVALARVQASNAQVLGAVLTKFDTKRAHYGYGYDYGYGYGYGEGGRGKTA